MNTGGGKNWGDLSEEEQNTKVKQIHEALKANGLDGVKIELIDQIIVPIKQATHQR